MQLSETLYLPDEQATEAFGRRLAAATGAPAPGGSDKDSHPGGTLGGRIFLHGDLGAGKTTLVRGLMRAYGHSGAVKSPTYTLVEPYEFSRYNIYHFDLYRLSDPEEVEFMGVADYLDPANLCLIEWPERGQALLPQPDIVIELAMEGSGRRLTWSAKTEHGRRIAASLQACGRNK